MVGKRRARVDAALLVTVEAIVLVVLWRAEPALGRVPLAHLGRWLGNAAPVTVLTACGRLLGLAVFGWLLVSTLAYGIAVLTNRQNLARWSGRVTPQALRRVIDTLAGATIAAYSITTLSGTASAAPLNQVVAAAHGHGVGPKVALAENPTGQPPGSPEATVGRHLPHPGHVPHGLPPTAPDRAGATDHSAGPPTQANGFAGLPPGTKVVVVKPGDCLSVLAQRHLGDWRLDQEIEAMNFGRLQADGRSLHDDHWIYPGWVLVMPKDAVGTLVVGGHGQATAGNTTAGQAGHSTTVPRPAPTTVAPTTAPPTPAPTTVAPTTVAPTTVAPTTVAPTTVSTPARRISSPPPLPSSGKPQELQRAAAERAGHSVVDLALESLVLGGTVSAGAIWALRRLREERSHSRGKGERLRPVRADVQAAERRARAISNEEALNWVDNTVRYLSGLVELECLDDAATPPSLEILRVGRHGIEVRLSGPRSTRLGWFDLQPDGTFRLDPDLTLEELQVLGAERWAAWPAVTALGEQDGMTLMANLEHFGSLAVDGPPERVVGMLSALALQLMTQPWSDEMISAVHVLGESALKTGGVVHAVPDEQAMDLAEKLDGISTSHQETAGKLSISAVRAVASEALPIVVLGFPGAHREAVRCIAEASVPETSGVVLVTAGPCPQARWHLTIGTDGNAVLEGEDHDRDWAGKFTVNTPPREVILLSEALDAARAPTEVVPAANASPDKEEVVTVIDMRQASEQGAPAAAGDTPLGPAAGHMGDQELGFTAVRGPERGPVEICFLGPVELVGGDAAALDGGRRTAALALIAYLACREHIVTAEELLGALWPLDASKENFNGPQRKTVMNVISRARAMLGYAQGGRERLIYADRGYRLSAEVTSDWSRFTKLVASARRQGRPEAFEALRQALELVRGEPFKGAISSHFFEWVASEHLDFNIAAQVVDVAQELGEMALEAEDYPTVRWAVEKGLQLEPTREELFRLWMHALGRTGRPALVDEVYKRLKLVLRQRIHPLQEPQPESRKVWRRYTAVEISGNLWD